MEIRHYLDGRGRDLYQEWVDDLRDQKAKFAIVRRVLRVESGNFGDHKFVRDGVWELRIDTGPGYRVYYAAHGDQVTAAAVRRRQRRAVHRHRPRRRTLARLPAEDQ